MNTSNKKKSACVIVLGDIGRSPRMQYHVKSLLEKNYHIDLIGNLETKPIDDIICTTNDIKIHDLFQFPDINLWKPIKYAFKILWQTLTLISALLSIKRPNFILIQNPPAIPTLIVCYFYCILYRTKFIIDWHNYTHTILALDNIKNHHQISSNNDKNIHLNFIAKLAKLIEGYYGSKAHANFCVTEAMKQDLQDRWSIEATVLYDRPPEKFHQINLEKKHEMFMKLSKYYSEFLPKDCNDFKERGVIESTSLTQKMINGTVLYKDNRPAILISSTSWTPDEDFNILFEALEDYEETAKDDISFPKLICIITGKGPQKDYYKKKIEEKCWKKVAILTPWLEAEDYPFVIASGDLGVCLHWSSSGLDLPMKIVDMFGCGLPVCAINFKCLNELVINEENGFIFDNSKQLGSQLKYWFKNFPFNEEINHKKNIFQNNLKKFQLLRWEENWKAKALPILEKF